MKWFAAGLGVLGLAWIGFGLATQMSEGGTSDTSLKIAFVALSVALVTLAMWWRGQSK